MKPIVAALILIVLVFVSLSVFPKPRVPDENDVRSFLIGYLPEDAQLENLEFETYPNGDTGRVSFKGDFQNLLPRFSNPDYPNAAIREVRNSGFSDVTIEEAAEKGGYGFTQTLFSSRGISTVQEYSEIVRAGSTHEFLGEATYLQTVEGYRFTILQATNPQLPGSPVRPTSDNFIALEVGSPEHQTFVNTLMSLASQNGNLRAIGEDFVRNIFEGHSYSLQFDDMEIARFDVPSGIQFLSQFNTLERSDRVNFWVPITLVGLADVPEQINLIGTMQGQSQEYLLAGSVFLRDPNNEESWTVRIEMFEMDPRLSSGVRTDGTWDPNGNHTEFGARDNKIVRLP